MRPAGHFDLEETQRIVGSSGHEIVSRYWGSYFALVHDRTSRAFHLLRDPTANLACYHARFGTVHVFFSDMDDFACHVDVPLTVHWPYMAARLLSGFSFSRDCSLDGIEDVPGGERVTISGATVNRMALWLPAEFCLRDPLEHEPRAAEELSQTVKAVTAALASEHQNIMVLLSGGLDSSIVASCLADHAQDSNIACLNFYIDGGTDSQATLQQFPGMTSENMAKLRRVVGSADERRYADQVARKCGFRIVHSERSIFRLRPQRMAEAPLAPRPSGYAVVFDEDDVECDLASATHATACFTGHGGDTVFFATLRAIGALDYAFLHPFGRHLFREIYSTVSLTRESLLRVAYKAAKHGHFRSRLQSPIEPMQRPHLLKDEIAALVPRNYFDHPWTSATTRLCPGKECHIAGVATSVPVYHNVYRRERIAPSVHPLASQPVVETCLRIPTYVLLTGGMSRGLARRAFRDILPAEVSARMTKGTGTTFYQNLVRHNVQTIREYLLEGLLIQNHLLDRKKVESYLTDEQPFLTVQAGQILDYLACEAWLRQVAARGVPQEKTDVPNIGKHRESIAG